MPKYDPPLYRSISERAQRYWKREIQTFGCKNDPFKGTCGGWNKCERRKSGFNV